MHGYLWVTNEDPLEFRHDAWPLSPDAMPRLTKAESYEWSWSGKLPHSYLGRAAAAIQTMYAARLGIPQQDVRAMVGDYFITVYRRMS